MIFYQESQKHKSSTHVRVKILTAIRVLFGQGKKFCASIVSDGCFPIHQYLYHLQTNN